MQNLSNQLSGLTLGGQPSVISMATGTSRTEQQTGSLLDPRRIPQEPTVRLPQPRSTREDVLKKVKPTRTSRQTIMPSPLMSPELAQQTMSQLSMLSQVTPYTDSTPFIPVQHSSLAKTYKPSQQIIKVAAAIDLDRLDPKHPNAYTKADLKAFAEALGLNVSNSTAVLARNIRNKISVYHDTNQVNTDAVATSAPTEQPIRIITPETPVPGQQPFPSVPTMITPTQPLSNVISNLPSPSRLPPPPQPSNVNVTSPPLAAININK